MQARYYDPEVGRFLSGDLIDPSVGNFFNFTRYGYANNNPIGNIDPSGKDCTKSNGMITCTPTLNGVALTWLPSIPPLPAPQNWPAVMNASSKSHHEYIYDTPIGSKSGESVAKAIAQDPTPNDHDRPATPQGTTNDAAPSSGFRSVLAGLGAMVGAGDDQVKSYTFKDSKGATWTVNVTQDSHTLSSGYVLRGVAQGVAVSYGEGIAAKQNLGRASEYFINDVWVDQNKKNIDEAH